MTAKIKLNAASGGGSVSLKAPSTTTSNAAVELQLPVADGSANQFIKTDGSGNLSFDTVSTTDNNTWVKLQTTTITSNTANVTFNNSITGAFDTYNTYVIVFNETRFSADDSNLYMRIFDSSGEYTSTEYATRTLDSGGDGNHTGLSYYRMNKEPIGNNSSGSDILEDVFGMVYMSNFKVNRRHRIHGVISFGDTGSNKRFNPFGGGINLNTETTGVKIYPQNGQINTGKFTLYGVAQ